MSNAMATASALNTTDSDLLQESIDESILPGFSEDELLNLFQSGAVQSWDRVFYRLGLQMPQKGSGGSVNIITSLLSFWVEHGGSSKTKLLDVLLQLQETDLIHMLGKEHILFIFSMIGHDVSNVISSLEIKWKVRRELAHAKFTNYLSHQRDVIQHSEEPLETLAKCFFEGCLRAIDFSHAAKQSILKNALIDFGFTEDTIDPKVIATWVSDKQHLLEIVKKLRMKPDIQDISRDSNYQYIEYFVRSVLITDISEAFYGLPPLMSSIIYYTSYSECVTLLQNAMIDTGISHSDPWDVDSGDIVKERDIKLVGSRFPKEKAENLGLALGFRDEEIKSLRILSLPTDITLSQWSKRTTFSRHKLFLAFCLSGYFDFATSQLYDMMPSDALVTKSFNQSGGEVYLEDHGIRLSVPMGALSGNQKITLTVLEEGPPIPSDDEVSICPGFRVLPSGLIFNLPIKVSLDHCVTVLQREQACKEGIVVYIRQEEGPKEQWKVMRYDLNLSSDCPVKVTLTHDKAEVYVTHFTSFWIKVKSMFIGSKRIGCTPFLPKYMPSNRRPVLRLYVHNTSASTVKRIQEEEENSFPVYCRTTPYYDFTMIPNRGQLSITCHDEGRSMHKTISYEDLLTLRRRSKNRLEFELDFTSLKHGEKNVRVDLFQGDEKRRRDMIIPTTFKESIVDHGADDASGSEKESSQSHGGVSEDLVEDIAAGFDDLSLGSGQASASSRSEAAATSTGQLTNEQLMDIAIAIPGESFVRFFLSLGFPVDYPHKVLEKWGRSYRSASEQLICEWALKSGSKVDELRNALCSSELKFLAHQYLPSSSQE